MPIPICAYCKNFWRMLTNIMPLQDLGAQVSVQSERPGCQLPVIQQLNFELFGYIFNKFQLSLVCHSFTFTTVYLHFSNILIETRVVTAMSLFRRLSQSHVRLLLSYVNMLLIHYKISIVPMVKHQSTCLNLLRLGTPNPVFFPSYFWRIKIKIWSGVGVTVCLLGRYHLLPSEQCTTRVQFSPMFNSCTVCICFCIYHRLSTQKLRSLRVACK